MIDQKLLQRALEELSEHRACLIVFKSTPSRQQRYQESPPSLDQLPSRQALRVQSALALLQSGKLEDAVGEIAKLSEDSRKHPLVIRIEVRCLQAIKEAEQAVVQA
ncbi:MAG TPA: hypothetical protein VEC99_00855 [Clostridia bacterium]|nr:hypothetical protein [Clostridia bacterium]